MFRQIRAGAGRASRRGREGRKGSEPIFIFMGENLGYPLCKTAHMGRNISAKGRKPARAGKQAAPKRNFDTQPQLKRLHWLVQRIQKGDYPSQKVLSEEWEVSWRTIQ